jgi:thymidylate synthase (FAD)
MRLIRPSFEILEQKPGLDGLLQHIERCGRTCYKSEDKITEESAPKFVDMLVKRGHTAMVEHGTVYLTLDMSSRNKYFKYCTNKYSNAISTGEAEAGTWVGYVTTNYRVLLQEGWLSDLEYITEPTKHICRITVKFVCDRGVSHEFVRHRVFSFAQESTRYCNYSKDKFGKECTFIIPEWCDLSPGTYSYDDSIGTWTNGSSLTNLNDKLLLSALGHAEYYYDILLKGKWIAQQARAVLPNSLKTELIMTGTIAQWEGFFKLRDANDAHPQARELAAPLHEEFIRRGLLQ